MDQGSDLLWWKLLSDIDRMLVNNMPHLAISYNMAGKSHKQEKSNCHKWTCFLYGWLHEKMLDYQVKSKVCKVWNRATMYKKPINKHFYPENNIAESLKTMEPDAPSVEIMVDVFAKYDVIYSTFTYDDNSTIRAVSK